MRRTVSALAIAATGLTMAVGCGSSSGGGPGTEPNSQVCATIVNIDKSEPKVGGQSTDANRLKAANDLHDFAVRTKAGAAQAASKTLHDQIVALATDLAEESVLVKNENATGITALQTRLNADAKALETSCPDLNSGG